MSEVDTRVGGLKPLMLIATIAAFVLAVVGAFNRGKLGTIAAGLAVAVIVAVPLVRVVSLERIGGAVATASSR